MSNKIGRPWYKKPTIVISAIVVILAAIIGATWGPLWSSWLNPPSSDFSISVNPMRGEVHQGGVIQTTVTVMGIHGYEHPVSLSASGQPSGVVVTFVPPIGGPTPSYTSTVTINVQPSVSASVYTTIIKGTGADGKEYSCKYTLSVISKPVTTPLPPIETVTFPEIKIISPKEGDKVPFSIIVSGTFSGKLPEGQYMWMVINPQPCPGQWWPQGRIDPWEEWNIHFWIGQEKEDIGKKFDIAVILVNEKDDQYYWDYLRTGQKTGSYPGILLPASAKIIDRITVMRK